MQHIVIFLIVAFCAFFVGRRFYRSFSRSSQSGCGCSGDCSGCGPQLTSICRPEKKSETPR